MPKRPNRRLFRDRICAVIAAPTVPEAITQIRSARRYTRTIEVRLDWLKSNAEREALFETGVRVDGESTIATCRNVRTGGRFRGSIDSQFIYLLIAVLAGAKWRDIEVEITKGPWKEGKKAPANTDQVIISYHNFKRTLNSFRNLLRRLWAREGDAIKIATQCNSIRDSLRVLELCKGRHNVIAVPMGEFGLPARVLALRHGSALAYAAVGEKTAPGQLTLDEMKNLYRADKLNRRSRVYGVIGNPVAHSLSPVLHNTALIAKRMNDVYLPFLVRDLPDFLAAIKPLGIAGFSVTLPHKEKILRHLDDIDPLAARIGAVNTVVVRGGSKLYGMNTDYVGVLRAIERRMPLRGSRVLIYGAGGAARAAAFALAQAGAIVCVSARRMKPAEQLARAVGGEAVARPRLRREFFDAIINATPVGMHPRQSQCPLNANELNCRLVFDLIYRPMQTKLLRLAAARGIETVNGVEMFIAQGAAQFEIWTGIRAPEKQMRAAVMRKLKSE